MIHEVLQGDALDLARAQGDATVDCLVTSPPYWGLRDYGVDGQLGLEPHPAQYLEALWAHADEWWRLLKPSGCLFVNLGDTYCSLKGSCFNPGGGANSLGQERKAAGVHPVNRGNKGDVPAADRNWLRPKQLLMIPSRFAIGMQERGWLLRNDVVWSKPNAMPSSVQDRFSCTWEHVFLFSKQGRYWFALDDVRESHVPHSIDYTPRGSAKTMGHLSQNRQDPSRLDYMANHPLGKNPGDTWRMATKPFLEAHFATFPPELPRRCIRAGCPPLVCAECGKPWEREVEQGELRDHPLRENRTVAAEQFSAAANAYGPGGTLGKVRERTPGPWHPACDCDAPTVPGLVLDPFCGAGTTGLVAVQEGRRFLGFELNPEYAEMAEKRIVNAQPPLVLAW